MSSIEALREIALRPAVDEGTVVRFKVSYGVRSSAGRAYNFIAVLLGGYWYSTAQVVSSLDDGSAVRPRMSQSAFANVLRSSKVSDIQVATEWENL